MKNPGIEEARKRYIQRHSVAADKVSEETVGVIEGGPVDDNNIRDSTSSGELGDMSWENTIVENSLLNSVDINVIANQPMPNLEMFIPEQNIFNISTWTAGPFKQLQPVRINSSSKRHMTKTDWKETFCASIYNNYGFSQLGAVNNEGGGGQPLSVRSIRNLQRSWELLLEKLFSSKRNRRLVLLVVLIII